VQACVQDGAECLIAAGDFLGWPLDALVAVQEATAIARCLLDLETLEETLVGRLISQAVGIENRAPDAPEFFHGE
jgi:hypothetical protein